MTLRQTAPLLLREQLQRKRPHQKAAVLHPQTNRETEDCPYVAPSSSYCPDFSSYLQRTEDCSLSHQKHRKTSNLQQFPKHQFSSQQFLMHNHQPRNPAACNIRFPPYRETDLPSHSPSPVRKHQHPYQSPLPQLPENAAPS